MKPHPRIRKTIKWGGAAVTVLLVAVWIGSGWHSWIYHLGGGDFVGVDSGQLVLLRLGAFDTDIIETITTHYSAWQPFCMLWWFEGEGGFPGWFMYVPMWIACAPALVITAAAWLLESRVRRRARLNLCANCNYDRTGLAVGAVCPECGSLPA